MKRFQVSLFFLLALLVMLVGPAFLAAEVIYLQNGDVIHGTLVAANNDEVTLETPYGKLVIPKKDIEQIDYQSGAEGAGPAPAAGRASAASASANVPTPRQRPTGGRAAVTLGIKGRSFWWAFDPPKDGALDSRIRLRVYVGNARACTFVDEKPDTVDGETLYNSFTFSPDDALLEETLDGYECNVQKSDEGELSLNLILPPESASGRQILRMVYEINEGDRETQMWKDVISRSFSIEVAPARRTVVVLEQNADALEYSGFFKKQMKNVELFQLNVQSSELRD